MMHCNGKCHLMKELAKTTKNGKPISSDKKGYSPVHEVLFDLDYATIFNIDLNLEYQILESLKWQSQLVYTYGNDSNNRNLPFISPFSYSSAFNYFKNRVSASIAIVGNATQSQFSPYYGENETPDYAVLNTSVGYSFYIETNKWNVRAGVENVFDTYYSTFSSWNNIPSQGRNFVLNLNFGF
jgi:iron complex outermembrane receptor protein